MTQQVITYKNKATIGHGIYTVPDLALILQLPANKVRRWLNEFYDNRLAGNKEAYSWGDEREKATNFLTLVEFYVFYLLREQRIGTSKILETHRFMSQELKTAYPFASYKLLANRKQILYGIDDETWVQTDGSNQILIHKLVETFFKKINFSDNNLAERFWPLGKDHAVVVDPHHQFGQPVINGTNINADTIYSMYQSGESPSTIGILYDLTAAQVNDAIHFCKRAAA